MHWLRPAQRLTPRICVPEPSNISLPSNFRRNAPHSLLRRGFISVEQGRRVDVDEALYVAEHIARQRELPVLYQ